MLFLKKNEKNYEFNLINLKSLLPGIEANRRLLREIGSNWREITSRVEQVF